ncbi:MAG TPA: phosphatase PAP2 family protein [Thermodesulfobacteriota bacterium]|nr:phosphatase PAP2 family protein [Thermodesulfobacteriota bacterium]
MISFFLSLDVSLFRLINQGTGESTFLDWFMLFMTNLKNFTYVLIILGIWIVGREGKAGVVFLVFLGITIAVTDQFSNQALKWWFGRMRPCGALPGVHLLTDCNTSYSFPSAHAVNIFAGAFFLSQPFRRLTPLWYAIAATVGYSRIYIGVHYPTDVIGGAGIGILLAWPLRVLKDRVVLQLDWASRPGPLRR